MKTTVKLLSLLILFATFSSCKKENTDAEATLSLIEKSSTANKNSATTQTLNKSQVAIGIFDFSKALVGVKKVKFKTKMSNNQQNWNQDSDQNWDQDWDQNCEYQGAYTFDLLTGTSTPSLDIVNISPGNYDKIKIKIDDVMPSGNSIEISGTYTIGGTSFQFEFTSQEDMDYEITNPDGISVSQNDFVTFLVEFDLESLFSNIDFATATIDQDGIIRINENSNSALQDIIENNLDNIMDMNCRYNRN